MRRLAVLALIVLLGLAVLGRRWLGRGGAGAPELLTSSVSRGAVKRVVSATGTLKAVLTVQVGSQVTGTIQSLEADFNSLVHAGQVIARIDPSTFRAQLERARADLVSARANLEGAKADRIEKEAVLRRVRDLSQRSVLSSQDLEAAEAQAATARAREAAGAAAVEQAKASVTVAEVNVDHTVIASPIDGVVVSRSVDVGQTVAASLQAPTLFVIANDLARMNVIASVDEADIGQIGEETPTGFTVDAFPNETFKGRIRQVRLDPQTAQNVVTYNVIVEVDNPERKLRPGMTANVSMTVAEAADVLRVANAALRFWPESVPREKLDELLGGSATPAPGQGEGGETNRAEGHRWRRRGEGGGDGGGPGGPRFRRGEGGPPPWAAGPGPVATAVAPVPAALSGELRFPVPPPAPPRPRIVWVAKEAGPPEPRRVMIGITDGSMSAVVGGDLKEGEKVVVGKVVPGAPPARAANPFAPQGMPGGGGGGGARR